MAKVRLKNVGQIVKKLESALRDVLLKDQVYVEISKFATERIRQKARLSKRMENDGSDSQPTPALSKTYIDVRKGHSYWRTINGKAVKFEGRDKKLGEVDPNFFLPNVTKSQLTFTGQLLKSLTGKIKTKSEAKGTLELEFKGLRKDGETNSQIYKYLLDKNPGYEILALSKKAVELIRNIVLTRLRQELIKKKLK